MGRRRPSLRIEGRQPTSELAGTDRKDCVLQPLAPDDVAGARVEVDEETTFYPANLEAIDVAGAAELGNIPIAMHLQNAGRFLAGEGEADPQIARLGIDGRIVLRAVGQIEIMGKRPRVAACPGLSLSCRDERPRKRHASEKQNVT